MCFIDRKGLGKDSTDKRTFINKEVDYKVDTSDFRQRKKDKLSSNQIWRDVRKCQHACEHLDKDKASDITTIVYSSMLCGHISRAMNQRNFGIGLLLMVMIMIMKLKIMK